jgi:membrane associated rhomboid family serine protease
MNNFSGGSNKGNSYFSGAKVSLGLAIAMATIFIIDHLLQIGDLYQWSYFSVQAGVYQGQVWRFLTAPWVHGSGGHLFGSLIFLLLIAPMLERSLSRRVFVLLIVLSVLIVPLVVTLIGVTGLVESIALTRISGGVGIGFGIAAALYHLKGDMPVSLMLVDRPFLLKNVILFYGGIWLLLVVVDSSKLGQEYFVSQVAGAPAILVGWWIAKTGGMGVWRATDSLRQANKKSNGKSNKKSNKKRSYTPKIKPKSHIRRDDSEVDKILDKISANGFQSLTAKEREILENASKEHD